MDPPRSVSKLVHYQPDVALVLLASTTMLPGGGNEHAAVVTMPVSEASVRLGISAANHLAAARGERAIPAVHLPADPDLAYSHIASRS